ncbi:MAG TPA: OmpA family protein [Thiotrichaceae bacterium]|nr:OmpA family protein [Thiotrichaceae bacterium]
MQLILKKHCLKVLNISVLLCSSILSNQLYADQLKSLEESWYVGGAAGLSQLNPKTTGQYEVTDKSGFSSKVYAGVDISNQWGVEGFWTNLGESGVHDGNGDDASVKYSALGVNAIYHIPLENMPIKPFAKLGVARFNTRSEKPSTHHQENNFSLFAGLGVEYALNKQFRLRAEYDHFSKDVSQFNVGLNWSPNNRDPLPLQEKKTAVIPAALPIVAVATPKPELIRTVVINKPTVHTIVREPIYIKAPVAPAPAPAPVKRTIVKKINSHLAGGSLFATNSAQLTPIGRSKMIELRQQIKQLKMEISHVQIIGHTDSRGSIAHNLRLSQQRAESVARFLQSQGLQRSIMSVIGYGESRPIATNDTEYGRATNRRVEIRIHGGRTVVTSG